MLSIGSSSVQGKGNSGENAGSRMLALIDCYTLLGSRSTNPSSPFSRHWSSLSLAPRTQLHLGTHSVLHLHLCTTGRHLQQKGPRSIGCDWDHIQGARLFWRLTGIVSYRYERHVSSLGKRNVNTSHSRVRLADYA